MISSKIEQIKIGDIYYSFSDEYDDDLQYTNIKKLEILTNVYCVRNNNKGNIPYVVVKHLSAYYFLSGELIDLREDGESGPIEVNELFSVEEINSKLTTKEQNFIQNLDEAIKNISSRIIYNFNSFNKMHRELSTIASLKLNNKSFKKLIDNAQNYFTGVK